MTTKSRRDDISIVCKYDGSLMLRKLPKVLAALVLSVCFAVSLQAQFVQQGSKLIGTDATGAARQGHSVAVSADGNTAIVGGLGDDGFFGAAWVFTRSGAVWSQQGSKLVASDAVGSTAQQGMSVAISADGDTAIVGGLGDSSNVGAVWVYTRSGGLWSQQGGKLVGSNAVGNSQQGYSVSISADGNTALVGGNADDAAGAAWVWTRSGSTWTQQGDKLVGTGAVGNASQGFSVALSGDGNTAMVGGFNDDGLIGAAWVYTRSGGAWTQQGSKLVGAGRTGAISGQGRSVALSFDGNTAIVGGNNDNGNAGAVWVWTRSGGDWTQQGDKLVGTGATGDLSEQGFDVSLSSDGNKAIIGAYADNNLAGAVWVWTRSGSVWTQQGSKLIGTGAEGSAQQGLSVALSADGNTAFVGGEADDSNAGATWVFVVPATAPGAPTGVIGTAGNAQVALSWTAPASDGGSPITGYQVQVATSVGGTYNNATGCPTNSTTPSCTATGLTNGTEYFFKVAAINGVGTGAYSAASSGVTPATTPDAPTGVSGIAGNTSVDVSWTAPVNNGGSAITGYQVQLATTVGGTYSNATGCPTNSTTSSCTATGITNGTEYFFKVAAINAVGQGPYSLASSGVTPATVPDAPTGVSGIAGNASVDVSWTAPGNNGGSAITGYQVQVATSVGGTYSNATGCPTNSTTPSCTATGLTNGTQYFFKVAAINGVGTGAYSVASSGVTPATVPDAPTGVSGIAGNAQVNVSWTAPVNTGGSAITGYQVQVATSVGGTYSNATGCPTNSTTPSCTATGLTNGTQYFFKVAAINGVGTGAYSVASSGVTPATVPDAPTGVSGIAGNAQVNVTWTAPVNTGGSAITGYQVQVATTVGGTYSNATGCPTNSTTPSCTATGLTNGTQYFFRVAGSNGVGQGPYSLVSSGVTPATVPDAPTNVSAAAGNAEASVSFTAPVNDGGAAITNYTATAHPGGATASGRFSPLIVTGLTNGTSYFFTVTATNSAGNSAESSASFPVTPLASLFSDNPLVAGEMPIRTVHVTELRQRINAVRAAHGLSAYPWTDPALSAGATIVRAVHIIEMRAALAQAYVQASRTPPTYTDPSLGPGTTIKVSHIAELRAAVIAIE